MAKSTSRKSSSRPATRGKSAASSGTKSTGSTKKSAKKAAKAATPASRAKKSAPKKVQKGATAAVKKTGQRAAASSGKPTGKKASGKKTAASKPVGNPTEATAARKTRSGEPAKGAASSRATKRAPQAGAGSATAGSKATTDAATKRKKKGAGAETTAPAATAPAVKTGKTGKSTTASAGRTARRRTPEPPAPRSVAAAASALVPDKDGYVLVNGRRVRAISTRGITIKKKSRSTTVVDPDSEPIPTLDPSKLKTKLKPAELERYRDLLVQRRNEILGLVNDMEDEALRSSGGNLSHMPIHMADIGSDTAEQDFTLTVAEKERQMLTEINAALERIEAGIYGVCQLTGKPIPKARLEAKPWAKFTIEAARLNEAGRLA